MNIPRSSFSFAIATTRLKEVDQIESWLGSLSIQNQINDIKRELAEAEKLKIEAKNLLNSYENKIDKSKKETQKIVNLAKKENEKNILEKTQKFHFFMENKKKNTEQKIAQMKENALKDIKNISIKISMEVVENLIKNSIDKKKLANFNAKSFEQIKAALKQTNQV